MNLSRMELADYANPSKIAQGIFDQMSELIIPVPVKDIALALDIKEIAPLSTVGYVGGLIIDSDLKSGAILVNENSMPQRQRFTIGHELGHFLIPWHALNDNLAFHCSAEQMTYDDETSKDKYMKKEAEANRFSSELLMPKAHFQSQLRKMPVPDLKDVFSMAKIYDVSNEACARRYVDLHDEPCAAIFSKDRVIRYSHKHPDFPFLDVKKGIPIPKSSLSYDSKIKVGEITEAIEVEPEIWISSERQTIPHTLFEQTSKMASGYQITLLFSEYSEEDEEDEMPHF